MKCNNYIKFMSMNDKTLFEITDLKLSYKLLDNKKLNSRFIYKLNKCYNLKYLNLEMNVIKKLPENMFKHLTNLVELNLSYNYCDTLPFNIFDNLVNLKELNLYNNPFTTLPANIFDKLNNLEKINGYEIKLDKNMLKIGCQKYTLDYWIDNFSDIAYQNNILNPSDILIYQVIVNKYYNQYKNSIN